MLGRLMGSDAEGRRLPSAASLEEGCSEQDALQSGVSQDGCAGAATSNGGDANSAGSACKRTFRVSTCVFLGSLLLLGAGAGAAVAARKAKNPRKMREKTEAKVVVQATTTQVEEKQRVHWPGSPVFLREASRRTCLAIDPPGMHNCTEEESREHLAYFETSGKIVTFWGQRCLTAKISLLNGTLVSMQECREHDPYQEWRLNETTQQLHNGGGQCLDAGLNAMGPHMWECLPGIPLQQQWDFGRFWANGTWQGDGQPDVQDMPALSPDEQAEKAALYEVTVQRTATNVSWGFDIKAKGVAKILHVDGDRRNELGGMKRHDLIIAVDGHPAMRTVDVARLMENKTQVVLKLRQSGAHHLKGVARNSSGSDELNSNIVRELPGVSQEAWEPLRALIKGLLGDGHPSAVQVGNERGLLFKYDEELLGDRDVRIASEMKFMHAVLTMRIVELGYVQLDDLLSKWLPWWPTEETDSRSSITLRNCLSMTTGFYGVRGTTMDGRPYTYNKLDQTLHLSWTELHCKRVGPITCAKLVLKKVPHIAPPGVLWTYTNDHLRLAVAVLTSATGQSYKRLLKTHIFDRTSPRMAHTRPYENYKYFSPGSTVYSTPRDYQRFLDAYFNGRLVSDASAQMIESDQLHNVKMRWFIGSPREPRPMGVGNFGFGTWRSQPVMRKKSDGWCGYRMPCAFAPSHYDSIAVLSRGWGEEAPKSACSWRHSSTCHFYYHVQNMGRDDSQAAFYRNQELSRKIEEMVSDILSGSRDENPWQCHHWTGLDNEIFDKIGEKTEAQKKVCQLNEDPSWEFVWTQGNNTDKAGCGECWCCKRPRVQLVF